MTSVRAVIVNWNSREQLRDCLRSLSEAARPAGGLEVVVVDNASSDASLEELESGDVPLTIIKNARNEGFAVACNQGAEGATSEYLLFLNPDARLFADSLTAPLSFLQSDEGQRYGAAGIQLVDERGAVHRSCARFPSPWHFVVRSLGLEGLSPRWLPGLFLLDFDHRSSRDVDHVIGAFLLVRRAAFEEVGGFDEAFFLYLEDLDLSLRLARQGHPSRFVGEASAFHKAGGTSDQVRGRRLAYWTAARLCYARKHFSLGGRALAAAASLGAEPLLRIGAALLRASPTQLVETAAGYGLLCRAFVRGDDVFRDR